MFSLTLSEKCNMVTSYTVDFVCRDPTYNAIQCAPKMPYGTIIESKCKSGHSSTEYLEVLKCGGGGSWDNTTPKCKPGQTVKGIRITIDIDTDVRITIMDTYRIFLLSELDKEKRRSRNDKTSTLIYDLREYSGNELGSEDVKANIRNLLI